MHSGCSYDKVWSGDWEFGPSIKASCLWANGYFEFLVSHAGILIGFSRTGLTAVRRALDCSDRLHNQKAS